MRTFERGANDHFSTYVIISAMSKPIYLVVTPFFPSPTSWRGAYCYDFVRALLRTQKYDVRVFVPGKGEDYVYQGVQVHCFPVKYLPSGLFPFFFNKYNQRSLLQRMADVGIGIDKVAVCHGHNTPFAIYPLAIKKHNPQCLTLLHHHDLSSFGLRLGRLGLVWINRFLTYFPTKRYHEQIDVQVFISKAVEKSFHLAPKTDWSIYSGYRRVGWGVSFLPPAKIKKGVVLHNGVDCSQFNPHGRQLHTPFTIGCIGNFGDIKDHLSLLRAVNAIREQLGDWKLRFIGSGPLLKTCQAYVYEQGLDAHVTFETEVDHTQLPDFYRSLDLFVLPSYFEGFGCVFTEAWACGTPFITCEGQGMDDLIYPEDRPLWLCKPKNPDNLAEKILHFYKTRPQQRLSGPVDINILVSKFLEEIEQR